MVNNDNTNINNEDLASGIVNDITKLRDAAAKLKEPVTLDDIDVSSFKPDSMRTFFTSLSTGMKSRAAAISAQNTAQADEVTDKITRDIAARQTKFQTDMAAFQNSVNSNSTKMSDLEKTETDVVLKNLSNNVVIINRNIEQLKTQKDLKIVAVNPPVVKPKTEPG
jgi:hypothetical protein